MACRFRRERARERLSCAANSGAAAMRPFRSCEGTTRIQKNMMLSNFSVHGKLRIISLGAVWGPWHRRPVPSNLHGARTLQMVIGHDDTALLPPFPRTGNAAGDPVPAAMAESWLRQAPCGGGCHDPNLAPLRPFRGGGPLLGVHVFSWHGNISSHWPVH